MAYKGRLYLLKKGTGDNSITMGNGDKKALLIGKLTRTICNKNDKEITMAPMSNVVYLLTGQSNLFSLTDYKKPRMDP
jgi:hypothetical protein